MWGQRSKNIIGLDIGQQEIKAAALKRHRHGWRLDHLATQVLPAGTENSSEVIVSALQKLWATERWTNRQVVTALQGDAVMVRYVKLPLMSATELRSVLSYEAEPYIPVAIDEVVLDFKILSQETVAGEDKMEVLLVAAKESKIVEHLEILKQANLIPRAITVDAFDLQNIFE